MKSNRKIVTGVDPSKLWTRYLMLSTVDIQLCCFLAGIYVCVHLFGCQNKSTCFAGSPQELAVKRLVTLKLKRRIPMESVERWKDINIHDIN